MKKFLSPAAITFIVLITILLLPSFLPNRERASYNDQELREAALSRGLSPVPKTFEALLKLVDTPKNPLTVEKIKLGKALYFDPLLSKNSDISCATCHSLNKQGKHGSTVLLDFLLSKNNNATDCTACHLSDQSGVDRFTVAVGHEGTEDPYHLNTPTILNAALAKYFTWNGTVQSVEEQAGISMQSHFRMNITPKELENRLKNTPLYAAQFEEAFRDGVSFENTKKAIGAYVRTLLTRGSYDRFLEGDDEAISAEAKRGLANFINFGCKGCHTGMSVGGQSLQRFPVRNFGSFYDEMGNLNITPQSLRLNDRFPFENKGDFLGKNNRQRFRVPILRNVTRTSPYFHNGAVPKIREAVDIMAKYQLGLNLSNVQIDEIVAFLKTLEGDIVDYSVDK